MSATERREAKTEPTACKGSNCLLNLSFQGSEGLSQFQSISLLSVREPGKFLHFPSISDGVAVFG